MKSFKSHIKEVYLPPEIKQFKHNVSSIEQKPADALPDHMKRVGNISAFMSKYGWTLLGNGAFARAYTHTNKDYIIKIFADDVGYLTWLKFVQANQDNPLVPKLRGKPVKILPKIYAVRLEKLEESEYEDLIRFKELYRKWKVGGLLLAVHTPKEVKHWSKFFDFFSKFKHFSDMHSGNLMKRPNGEIVVTDPLAYLDTENLGKYPLPDDAKELMYKTIGAGT